MKVRVHVIGKIVGNDINTAFESNLSLSNEISDVKSLLINKVQKQLEMKTTLTSVEPQLLYQGIELANEKTMKDYSIRKNDLLVLLLSGSSVKSRSPGLRGINVKDQFRRMGFSDRHIEFALEASNDNASEAIRVLLDSKNTADIASNTLPSTEYGFKRSTSEDTTFTIERDGGILNFLQNCPLIEQLKNAIESNPKLIEALIEKNANQDFEVVQCINSFFESSCDLLLRDSY